MPTIGDFLLEKSLNQLDNELLLGYVMGKERTFVLAHPEKKLSPIQVKRLKGLIQRRKRHEPLAYILGKKEFYGRNFFVSSATLIPRPETEVLVEKALKTVKSIFRTGKNSAQGRSLPDGWRGASGGKKIALIDVGTGSGCIIISLTKEFEKEKNITWYATDISSAALQVAKKNAKKLGVNKKVKFLKGDLLLPLLKKLRSFDHILVVANLPYLSSQLYHSAPPEVKDFEPKSALVSEKKGLAHTLRLLNQLKTMALGQKASFFLEISPEQASLVEKFLPPDASFSPDISGRIRVVSGTLS